LTSLREDGLLGTAKRRRELRLMAVSGASLGGASYVSDKSMLWIGRWPIEIEGTLFKAQSLIEDV
jgi:hypothetical protein